ncbi:MAG: hypothetical protein GY750_13750 [Lentisphaerae bacterium]|nr:hypothetical protein [Lentisphaerota bacterium]
MTEPEMFPKADARPSDPTTSRIAAAALDMGDRETARRRGQRIVSAALTAGPATDDELRERIAAAGPPAQMAHGSVAKRRLDLEREGLVRVLLATDGREVMRLTRSGTPARVYCLSGWGVAGD